MQNFRNYYEILNIDRSASPEEVKKAFRQLARRYHPDLNPGNKDAEERFKDINEAYEVLSDSTKRARYDQFGRYWKQQGFQPGQRSSDRSWWNGRSNGDPSDAEFSEFRDFNSFVDHLLNKREPVTSSVPRDPQRIRSPKASPTTDSRQTPRNVEARLVVPLKTAYQGGRERVRLEDGRSLEVELPAGMVSGQRIRLRGQGVAGGDLFLKIEVSPHAFFRVEGDDVFCQVPITPSEAVLGGEVDVLTLDGPVTMKIPAGVRAGQQFRLARKGYPSDKGDRGDQIVELQIVIPRDLNDQELELYEKLRQLETFKPRANLSI
jgi:curved DNA-binding protein